MTTRCEMLQEAHAKGEVETRFEWGGDFGAPDETYLSNQFDRPVMVHRYPRSVKAFYMKADPERARLGAVRGCAGAGRLRRDNRRRAAR